MNNTSLVTLLEAMFHQSKEMILFVNNDGEIVYMNAHAAATLDDTNYDKANFSIYAHIARACMPPAGVWSATTVICMLMRR